MRVAVALSGLSRVHPISAASWGRIVGRYQADVYVHSWKNPTNCGEQAHLLNWIFKPSRLVIDDLPEVDVSLYPDRHWPCIDVYRSICMWHGINRAHNMVRTSGEHYDIVIRGRMDWHVHHLDILEFDGVVIPHDPDKIPLSFPYDGQLMHGLNDHFAYASIPHMDAYVKTLEEIPALYRDEGVDYCPENFLAAALHKQRIPVMFQRMEHKLIRT